MKASLINSSSTKNQTAISFLGELENFKYQLSPLIGKIDIELFLKFIGPWHSRCKEIEGSISTLPSNFLQSRLQTVLGIFQRVSPEYLRELVNRYQIEPSTVQGEVRSMILQLHCAITPLQGLDR